MMAGYAIATFEVWENASKTRIALSKAVSRLVYLFCSFLCLLTNIYREQLTAAADICRFQLPSKQSGMEHIQH